MRVVVSLTTLPTRYDYLVKTLDSIKNQTRQPDAIYLTIPEKAKRTGQSYPPLPSAVSEYCNIVKIKKDWGPICKLYGALIRETHSDTVIVTVDDDVVYPPTLIEIFLSKFNNHYAITGTGVLVGHGVNLFSINTTMTRVRDWNGIIGFPIPPQGRVVDIVQGFSGCMYRRGFFPPVKHLYKQLMRYTEDADVFKSDDILVSAHLCKKNINIMTFNFNDVMPAVHPCLDSPDALSGDLPKMLRTFEMALTKLTKWGFFTHWAPMEPTDSCVIKVSVFLVVIIVFILLLVFAIYMMYRRHYGI